MITFTLNGTDYTLDIDPSRRLIDLIRDDLGLTGAKEGCGEGECGSCTVIMDGRAVCSCLVPVAQIRGKKITTIEGLERDGKLDPLQEQFIEKGAVQCGYCTPGMILSAKALMDESPHPDREEIKQAIEGNLCRCTGYNKILDAIEAATGAWGDAEIQTSMSQESSCRKNGDTVLSPESSSCRKSGDVVLSPGSSSFRKSGDTVAIVSPNYLRKPLNGTVVLSPESLDALTHALKQMTPKSKILAGGTDLIIALKNGSVQPDMLLDLSGVNELKRISISGEQVVIGGGTPFTDIINHEGLQHPSMVCLPQAALCIGSVQIRNRATLAGNIATASPAADSLPALMALNAEVGILNSAGKTRHIPLEALMTGPYRTALAGDEVIVNFRFPLPHPDSRSCFVKLGTRSRVTIARLSLAMNLHLCCDDDPEIPNVLSSMVVLGAVGKTAFRAKTTERLLTGNPLDPSLKTAFVDALVAEVENSIPGRYSLPYKKDAIVGVALEAWNHFLPKTY